MIRSIASLIADLRAGRALRRLHEAKKREGLDFSLGTSWCSDEPLMVVILRRRSAKVGQPVLGPDPGQALRKAEARVRAGWGTK